MGHNIHNITGSWHKHFEAVSAPFKFSVVFTLRQSFCIAKLTSLKQTVKIHDVIAYKKHELQDDADL